MTPPKIWYISTKEDPRAFARIQYWDGELAKTRYACGICAPFMFPEMSDEELENYKFLTMNELKVYFAGLRGVSPGSLVFVFEGQPKC